MMKLVILVAVSAIVQQVYCNKPERLIGGEIADIGQFKYLVSLQSYGKHICAGSIINSTQIVTAAHCVDDDFLTKDMIVVSGTNILGIGGEKHDIKCIQKHPQYTGKNDASVNDIAVITLKNPIKANNVQGPIPLASKDYVNGGEYRGIISGWGKTDGKSSEILRWRSVNVLSQENCLKGHKNPRTNKNQICVLEETGKVACLDDSGGPLVVDGEVVGVAS